MTNVSGEEGVEELWKALPQSFNPGHAVSTMIEGVAPKLNVFCIYEPAAGKMHCSALTQTGAELAGLLTELGTASEVDTASGNLIATGTVTPGGSSKYADWVKFTPVGDVTYEGDLDDYITAGPSYTVREFLNHWSDVFDAAGSEALIIFSQEGQSMTIYQVFNGKSADAHSTIGATANGTVKAQGVLDAGGAVGKNFGE